MPDPKPGLNLHLDQIAQVDRRIPVLRSEPVVDAAGEFVRTETARLAPRHRCRNRRHSRSGGTATEAAASSSHATALIRQPATVRTSCIVFIPRPVNGVPSCTPALA